MIRNGAGLAAAQDALAAVPARADAMPGIHAAPQVAEWETTNVHQVASALTAAAAARTESRGGHFREDFPESDDAWRLRLVTRLGPDGTAEMARVAVPDVAAVPS